MTQETPFVITPDLAEPFSRFAETVSDFLADFKGIEPSIPEEDPDMQEVWENSLRDALEEDCQRIVDLVNHKDFGINPVHLKLNQVDAMLRACSAIRLKIHRTHLKDITDSTLENGEVDPTQLAEQTRRAYIIYMFLAQLQETLIEQME